MKNGAVIRTTRMWAGELSETEYVVLGIADRRRGSEQISICREYFEDIVGKKPKIGMRLALVDLADYDVEGFNTGKGKK